MWAIYHTITGTSCIAEDIVASSSYTDTGELRDYENNVAKNVVYKAELVVCCWYAFG